MCEEGGNWSADSSRFSGGLGITRANWDIYGGQEFASEGAMATEDQQIMVAERIQPNVPDQYGCRGREETTLLPRRISPCPVPSTA